MALLVLAFPDLQKEDFDAIQLFRKEHDELYNIVEPHFTIVFPVFDFSTDDFIYAITDKAIVFHSFDVVIREAILHKDELTDYFLAFLVPDEGYKNLVSLHDNLYRDRLESNLRSDIPYIPHVNIGKSKDIYHCKRIIDEWNMAGRVIHCIVNKLTIVNYENNQLKKLQEIQLQQK